MTTVYVTHDQTEDMTMADHIVLLNGGHIMQEGTPNDLYEHPANEFVAGFLGTPQINIFPCDVKQENGALILDGGDEDRIRAIEPASPHVFTAHGERTIMSPPIPVKYVKQPFLHERVLIEDAFEKKGGVGGFFSKLFG